MTTNLEREVYLDHHSTTPVDDRVFEEMKPYFTEKYSNPASKDNHALGQEANRAMEAARKQVADAIGAETGGEVTAKSIIFTSGATESDNLALQGLARTADEKGIGKHIVTSEIEHDAILETCKILEERGFEVTYVAVDEYGRVDPADIDAAIQDDTFIVSVMAANNEIGTINPIEEIGDVVSQYDETWFHSDAVQAIGYLDVNVNEMNIDLMSISGHKIYGPNGIGALYANFEVKNKLQPILFGGGHESNKRSGTPNVPAIVGLGEAMKLADKNRQKRVDHVEELRDLLWERISSEIDDVILNGHPEHRLPNNLNVSFPSVNAKELVRMSLSNKGIMAALGSACSSDNDSSHVMKSIADDPDRINNAVRFGLGKDVTEPDIEYAADVIIEEVSLTSSIFG